MGLTSGKHEMKEQRRTWKLLYHIRTTRRVYSFIPCEPEKSLGTWDKCPRGCILGTKTACETRFSMDQIDA